MVTPSVLMRPVYYASSLLHKALRSLGPTTPQTVKVRDILASRPQGDLDLFVADEEERCVCVFCLWHAAVVERAFSPADLVRVRLSLSSVFGALRKMVASKTYSVPVTNSADPSRIVGLVTVNLCTFCDLTVMVARECAV